jgi:PAS domain S-box-containing protein
MSDILDLQSGQGPAPARSESELRLRAMFDHTVQLMGVLSPDGTLLDVNRVALEFGGLTADEVIGRPFWETGWWQESDDRPRLRDAVRRAARGEFVRFDVDLPTREGLMATIDFSLTPVRLREGTVSYLVAEGRDVTEAKWAERALRTSEAKFAGIISIASDAIISVDENFEITLFNQGAESIFGYRATEVLGRNLEMLLPERFRAGHARHMRNFEAAPVSARRMGERQEIMGRRRDGTEFTAEASISKMDLSGAAVYTVVLRDVTERKRIEQAQRFLAEAGAILASSLDYERTLASVAGLTVPDLADWSVIYIREDDGSVRRLDVAHADPDLRGLLQGLLRYPLDRRSPHPVFTVLDTGAAEIISDIDDEYRRALSQVPEQQAIYERVGLGSIMMVPLRAHGQTRGAMGFFSAQPRRYGPDELALATDLALLAGLAVDNARLYRDARAAVQARDDMIAVVSHDLGNPLSAIRIGTSLLLRAIPEGQQGSGGWQHLDFIRQSAQQMENLINDLLDVKRLETGRVSLQLAAVAVDDVVQDVIDVFRPIATGRNLDLKWTANGRLPPVAAEHQRLVQVLSNLVSNAVKFTDPGGRILISARAANDVVTVTVADTGHGIAAEHLPHIFDRFWQAQREGRKGLGLGLAIARGIIDAHGGRIWCESKPGAGTTFLFTLPAARPA